MNAMTWLPLGWRRPATQQYTPSGIPAAAIEASQKAVKGYSFSRIRNAERNAKVSARYGHFGLLFGLMWLGMWMYYPQRHDVHHWMIWDGVHGMPYELPDFNVAVKDAPEAMHRYFSEEYVRYREQFYYDTFAKDRNHVAWQTGKDEMAEYNAATDAKNPDSPVVAMGKKGFVEIEITGSDVTYDKEHDRYKSEVYYTRREQVYGQPRARAISRKAEFTWEKHPEGVPDNARDYSPIGMVVVHYHRFQEGVTQ